VAIASLTPFADDVLSALATSSINGTRGSGPFDTLFLPTELTSSILGLSPTDLVTLLTTARQSLLSLASSAAPLDLANPTSSLFATTVSSSEDGVIAGSVVNGISTDTVPEEATYAFTVSQLAVAQATVGTALASTAANAFTAGTNTVRFTQDGTTTDVSFDVTAGDSNQTVLTSFANAINATTGLGVSASVVEDATAGTSQLVLQSKTTGTTNAFTVTSLTGNPVADAGVGSATTAAQDAAYTQDGIAFTRDTNDFYLGTNASLHVQLLQTTITPVTLTVAPDTSAVASAVDSLVSDFNGARDFFAQFADVYGPVASQLQSAAFRLQGQLETIGVHVAASGTVSVDTEKLGAALEQSFQHVQTVLGDVGGFAKELRQIAETQLSTPSAQAASQPPFQAGYGPGFLTGAFARHLAHLQLQGLLVNALA